MSRSIFFYDENGQRLGSESELLPIPLYKGMAVTVHGHAGIYLVSEWTYHKGHSDEDSGLHVYMIKQEDNDSVFALTDVEPFHNQKEAMDRVKEAARKNAIEKSNG